MLGARDPDPDDAILTSRNGLLREIWMYRRVHEPEAVDRRSAIWAGGRFDAGRRSLTRRVEGVTRSPDHVVLVTLTGGARRLGVETDDGHRYDGPDIAGAVSFLPAFCERKLVLDDVEAEWASVSISAPIVDAGGGRMRLPAFSNVDDPLIFAIVREIDRMQRADGVVDAAYCETMSLALMRQIVRRAGVSLKPGGSGLSAWKLKRVRTFVEAHLHRPISIAELADLAGLSSGHFHRAFREASGETPLRFIQRRRIERALGLLRENQLTVVDVSAAVGFESPSHFARVFRAVTGRRPSEAAVR